MGRRDHKISLHPIKHWSSTLVDTQEEQSSHSTQINSRTSTMMSKIFNKKYFSPSKESSSPDNVLYRKNEFVPKKKPTTPTTPKEHVGREILYEPTLVLSPVYASCRVHKETKRLITVHDIDELVARLDKLLVTKKTEDAVVVEEEKSSEQDGASSKSAVPKSLEKKPSIGRFEAFVFSKKANGEVAVKRSGRLAL